MINEYWNICIIILEKYIILLFREKNSGINERMSIKGSKLARK